MNFIWSWKKFRYWFLKIFLGIVLVAYLFLVIMYAVLFIGPEPTPAENILWGVNFSQRQAEALGLDWKETYTAILDDLNAKHVRIPIYWDELEKERGVYDFSPWDWQLAELEKRGGKAILVVGFKLPRWPECHFPEWYDENKSQQTKDKYLFQMIRTVVVHYRDNPTVIMWQIENEPFLNFGECPDLDKDLLDAEIKLVRSLDPSRKIMITDSGEWSTWIESGKRSDIFGSTLYRIIHDPRIGYLEYTFFTPTFHARKAFLLHLFRPEVPVIVIELQAEPWVTTLPLSDVSLEEQYKTLSPKQFRKNMNFARATGFDTFYLWGAEWWYWLKEIKNESTIWNEARTLFREIE